jgi:hypothetical protein
MRNEQASGWILLAAIALGATAAVPACGSGSGDGGGGAGLGGDAAADGAATGATDAGDEAVAIALPDAPLNAGPYSDFPTPVIDATGTAPPASAPGDFGAPGSGAASGGPCLYEPEVGTLYPKNWVAPRFSWTAGAGQNVFELRLHIDNQTSDLVVYTTQNSWRMSQGLWDALRMHSYDTPMTVTVRGGVASGGKVGAIAMGTSGDLGVAPVEAPGAVVYWSIYGGTGQLRGFQIGDDGVVDVIKPAQAQPGNGTSATCIGCHSSTPDGLYAGFVFHLDGQPFTNALGSVETASPGSWPSYVSPTAKSALAGLKGISAFSLGHWASGDHVELLSGDGTLQWVKLDDGSTGTIARTGDAHLAVAPAWSHDGKTIAYTSTDAVADGRPAAGSDDLYAVPYGGGSGGAASAVAGAAEPDFNEYYPSFSPDDRFLAFSRFSTASGTNDPYNQPQAELYLINASGGASSLIRHAANDPPACTGKKSPGLTNSWPKWAPAAADYGTRRFYWAIFSSRRAGDGKLAQLYLAPTVVDGAKVTTYAALYVTNQPADQSNHTPAWDVFKIPSSVK